MMNDNKITNKKSADRIPDLPIKQWRRETGPTDSEDYTAAISEGWPVSPHPHDPKSRKRRP